jgi:sugar phosphate isomerase/epimerase
MIRSLDDHAGSMPYAVRGLIGCLIAVFTGLSSAATAEPLLSEPPGMVSYTYREPFKTDIPGTLDAIRRLGVRDIEFSNLFGATAAVIRRLLDERGMTCSSYGVGYEDLIKSTATVAADAKTLGARFVRVAWIPHKAPFTADHARAAATDFNRIGRLLREQHGLTFCYHNHGYEFATHGDGTLFDLIAAETDPADVAFELDILWAHFGGADPAAIIERHGSRVKLLHLKDLRRGVQGNLSGRTPPENDVALGSGQIDIPAVLRAARKAGVAHAYIEDESPLFAEQVPRSIAYLQSLKD